MEVWKEFEANELTHSAAHHLLAIQELGGDYGGWARVSDIAKRLGITRGSVSINLRALKKRGLVLSDEHRMIKLSTKGAKIVQGVMANKLAVKAFLSDILGVDAQQAEIDSCKIEHLLSHSSSARLVHFMRFLTSEDSIAQEMRARFQHFHNPCPDTKSCAVCKDHCLIEELTHAS